MNLCAAWPSDLPMRFLLLLALTVALSGCKIQMFNRGPVDPPKPVASPPQTNGVPLRPSP